MAEARYPTRIFSLRSAGLEAAIATLDLGTITRAGGLMRFNIPAFRLPESVLNEETQCIIDMGAEVRYNTPVSSLKELLSTSNSFDAVFVHDAVVYMTTEADLALAIKTAFVHCRPGGIAPSSGRMKPSTMYSTLSADLRCSRYQAKYDLKASATVNTDLA